VVVRFEFSEYPRPPQKLDHIHIDGREIVEMLDSHQLFGFWRTELDTGHVFWSSDIFEIYGMEFTDGPINLARSNAAVHPDDLPYMLELFERAAEEKTGFHYILRLKDGPARYKYVRSVGKFRVTPEGREELYGILEQFHEQVPLVGIIGGVTAKSPTARKTA
jgi:PAS fold.